MAGTYSFAQPKWLEGTSSLASDFAGSETLVLKGGWIRVDRFVLPTGAQCEQDWGLIKDEYNPSVQLVEKLHRHMLNSIVDVS